MECPLHDLTKADAMAIIEIYGIFRIWTPTFEEVVMRRLTLTLPIYLLFFSVSQGFPVTIHVPGDQPTVQEGLDAAASGDTVMVAAGTFFENIIWPDVDGIKLIGAGRENTIIDGGNIASVIRFDTANIISRSTAIVGLTVTNGNAQPPWPESEGGGIFLFYADPVITNVDIRGNFADDFGGGVYSWNSYPLLKNVLIADNEAISRGGFVGDLGSPTLQNVTVAGNSPGGLYFGEQSSGLLENCIVDLNYLYGIELQGGSYTTTVIDVAYSDIDDQVWEIGNSHVNWLDGNIEADPLFVDPYSGDYRLQNGSPCIDAGDPSFDVPRGGACIVDMGAFEFWQGIDCHRVSVKLR